MAVLAALAASFLYACASVIQHRLAAAQPDHRSMRPSLLLRLARRPAWLAGIVADLGAYACQFVALAHGSLVLVQPLLVTGLLMALPLAAALDRRRVTRRELASGGVVVVGLAVFLVVASPGAGHGGAGPGTWLGVVGAGLGVTALMIIAAGPRSGVRRACTLAAAAGTLTGLTSALTKATAVELHSGLVHVLASWQPYSLAACGLAALLMIQSAFQAGPLRWSLPTLTVTETVVGVLIGAVALGEATSGGAAALAVQAAGLAAVGVGVFALGQAPLGRAHSGRVPEPVA